MQSFRVSGYLRESPIWPNVLETDKQASSLKFDYLVFITLHYNIINKHDVASYLFALNF